MRKMKKAFILSLLIIYSFYSCNRIKRADELSKADIDYLISLKLLNPGERIYKFYSEFKFKYSGNFFTDKGVAIYWIDKRDSEKNVKIYSSYEEIVEMKPIYKVRLTYCPFIMIKKRDGGEFKLCADGSEEEIKDFFNSVITVWKEKVTRERKTGFEPAAFSLGN